MSDGVKIKAESVYNKYIQGLLLWVTRRQITLVAFLCIKAPITLML